MGRSQETFSKKENEKKKKARQKEKEEKKEERKANSSKGKGLEDMMAYIDEDGNISSTPPDPKKMREAIKAENIQIGVPRHSETDSADATRSGTVTHYNDSKGYGFIKDQNTGDSIFVHVNSLVDPITEGSKVTFETERGPKGLNAVNVKVIK